ncbi:hypothetical protein AAKU52_003447, partial [Pedobacter sp. CG_S7]|uniref:hypothetical protein n=1 Tax=Pedobacter sp. CG_S7 TaxID=3143930 RepID=UPI0033932E03
SASLLPIILHYCCQLLCITNCHFLCSFIYRLHLAYQRYAKIFLRNSEPFMKLPIAVLTDSDARTFEVSKNADKETIYTKIDDATVAKDTLDKINTIVNKDDQSVKHFVAPSWTLEYCLFKSSSLNTVFSNCTKKVHTKTDWADFESALAIKLINKGFKKTEISYLLAI